MSAIQKQVISILAVLSLGGCALQRYQPAPLVPSVTAARFESRSLTDADLETFEQRYFGRPISPWPPKSWDLRTLSVAALYFNPAIDMARARLATAQGAVITARARPNPTIDLAPGIPGPYLLSLDFLFPIEAAGKRGHRIQIARDLDKAAQFDMADTAWTVVIGVRLALLNYLVGSRNLELLHSEEKFQEEQVAILEQQLAAGEMTSVTVDITRMDLSKTKVAIRAAEGEVADAKAALAAAIGIPVAGLDGAHLSWPEMDTPPSLRSLSPATIQRDAVLNRLDVRRSLAQYAAADAALQLEIAKQYPNLNIGPGYTYEEKNNFFTVALSTTLPILNRNQGPIAEAEGRRKEAAAAFLQTQAQVIDKSDRALENYRAALKEMSEALSPYRIQENRLQVIQQAIRAGSDTRLTLDGAQIQLSFLASGQLDALARAQRALGDLEDAVQRPLAPDEVLPIDTDSPTLDKDPVRLEK
jgi:outer membrane protein, heavy metal efflux system